MMEIIDIIQNNYSVGLVIQIRKTEHGSGNTFLVETKLAKYIAKTNERIDFLRIYDQVQDILNQQNLLQSKLIRTNQGFLATPEGLALYEYISGDTYQVLSKSQCENALKYIRRYNEALKAVPFSENCLDNKNHWDQAKSIDFIIDQFPGYLSSLNVEVEAKQNIAAAIEILSENKTKITTLQRQLIHSDLGSDNFIFQGDQVISIIDFTPEYSPEIYSLCQFIYWNYLWVNRNNDQAEINRYLKIYNLNAQQYMEMELFSLLMIKAALYRIIGPLIDLIHQDIKDYHQLQKRFCVLSELLKPFKK
jgi:Ser/Thr protein kinase RdoA (MazF antagonist)